MRQILRLLVIVFASLGNGSLYAKLQGQPPPLAGQALIDSLLKELPQQKEDTNKVNLLNALSWDYSLINPEEGLKYGQQSMELATKLDWKKGMANGYHNLGTNYMNKSDYPKALEYYFKALKIDEEIGNKTGVAAVTGNIGSVYIYQHNYGISN